MNWLAKISWNNLRTHLGAFNSLILLACLVGGLFYGGYRFGNYYHGYQQNFLQNQQNRLDELYQKQEASVQRINTLAVELELERLANQQSMAALRELEQSNFELKKELTFYQMVMAPEKQADGLVIENVEIFSTESENHYRYRLVLVQQQKSKRYVKGKLNLQITGSLNNKRATLDLKEVSDITNEQLSFSFQFFQVLEGELLLPPNFVAEQISVSANLPKTRWQKANTLKRRFDWPDTPKPNEAVIATILD